MAAQPIATKPLARQVLGLDIGGTKLSAAGFSAPDLAGADIALVKESLDRLAIAETPAVEGSFINRIVELLAHVQGDAPPGEQSVVPIVGISTAGIANPTTGAIMGSTGNLPAVSYSPFPLAQLIEARLNCRVHLENDANAAAYGEFRLGAAQGAETAVMITLGTGVGCGLIINGKLHRGANFSAGEAGHTRISLTNDRECTCGRIGCWEIYASGTGLRVTARREIAEMPHSKDAVDLLAGKPLDTFGTHDLVAAYKRGNRLADSLLDKWHFLIATGLGSLMNVLDPDVVVIGGGMAQFVEVDRLKNFLEVRTMGVMRDTPIRLATLGNKAGMIGAAYLAMERFATGD